MVCSLTLRPATEDDKPFLYQVYASTRTEELAAVDWSAVQKADFLRWQAEAQDRYYREHYQGAEFQVIMLGGRPIGRLYLHRRPDEIRIMDIALLPDHRRQGFGTHLLQAILAEGRRTNCSVTIHVEHFNPAMSLYRRLGFGPVTEHGAYLLMAWRPDADRSQER